MNDCTFSAFPYSALRTLSLDSDEIAIWSAPLKLNLTHLECLQQCLPGEELQRATRAGTVTLRQHNIATRAWLRHILAAYLDVEPAELRFCYGTKGKPGLIDAAVQFNLSHAGDRLLLAITASSPIGVDIERVRGLRDAKSIARRFFSLAESQTLAGLPAAEIDQAFFRCWTRKEAYLKALGGGISLGLAGFSVSFLSDQTARFLHIQDPKQRKLPWSLYHLEPAPGYIGAVAIVGKHWQLRGYTLECD